MRTMKKPTLLILALSVACLTCGLQAQDANGEKSIKCRFRFYGWDEPITDLHYNLKGKDTELVIYQDSRSIFYDYSGPEVLSLYRLKTDADGNVVREMAANANLAKGGSWPLIVISSQQAKPGIYQTVVLKDDLISFPAGSYAFSNFSSTIVGGYLGTEEFVISPGESKLLAGTPKSDSTTLAALFFKVAGNKKEPIYTNNWAIRPAIRTRVFVKASSESPSGIVARRLVESTYFPPTPKDALTQAD